MTERYTIERGDWGLFFYDQKEKKQLSFEDVGDILNGIEELSSEALKDIETMCNLDEHLYINYSITVAKIKKKWRDRSK